MNSKSIIPIVFGLWSIICWRWYVCGIMNACGDNAARLSKEEVVAVPDDRADYSTPVESPEIRPLDDKKTADIPSKGRTVPANTNPIEPINPAHTDKVQIEAVGDRIVIHFPYKSSRKEDNAAVDAYLASLAAQLISSGEKVTITGHTDFVGEPDENYTFGLRRANGLRDILIKKGVGKSQIKCRSFGDRKPVATNDTPYGRYLNRRAEIRVGS